MSDLLIQWWGEAMAMLVACCLAAGPWSKIQEARDRSAISMHVAAVLRAVSVLVAVAVGLALRWLAVAP